MTFNTIYTNIVIDGNTFDYGVFSPDGNTVSTSIKYSYFNCITTTSNATIINNYISGSTATATPQLTGATQLVLDVNTSAIVKNNSFIRGSTAIYAYIISNVNFESYYNRQFF